MSIADWLKAINERNRAKLRQEGRQVGLQEGLQQGYEIGYEDSQEGRAKQPPATNNREDQQC
jgi:flagellar biosynthesis/type III secretory pathway protein FliH